jgi:hypothetical protein
MSNLIDRPTYYEGQILGAADLQGAVDHASGQTARHERYLHLWGIAAGLTLTKQPQTTAQNEAYVEVTLGAGVAIDGTGREVLVPEDVPLSEAVFEQTGVDAGTMGKPGDPPWFPVFLVGRDEASLVPAAGATACGPGQTTRTVENFVIEFGRPGDAAKLDQQRASVFSVGPGDGAWKVLVGFVRWNSTIGKFTDIGTGDDGIGVRYAGAQADEVAARGGTLILRSAPRTEAAKPAVVMDTANGGELRFGLQDAFGKIKPVFTVNAKGDVVAVGKLQGGAVEPGTTQVQSGTATDGIILPLPPGVTEQMVEPGKATVHILLTPRVDGTPTPGFPDQWGGFPVECFVDGDRRLHCLIRWLRLTGTPTVRDLPGLCDYLLIVTVPAKGAS